MDSPLAVVLLTLVAVALVVLLVWGILRWRYIESLRKRGWEFDGSPSIDHVVGLNRAPFGVGMGRKVDDLVHGAAQSGVRFKAIEYDSKAWSSQHYVVYFTLPRSLPFLYARPTSAAWVFPGIPAGFETTDGATTLRGESEEYTRRIAGAVAGLLPGLGGHQFSIDHAHLVVFDVASGADELHAVVEAGAAIAQAIAAAAEGFSAPAAPGYLSFSHRPNWAYEPRGDHWLSHVPYTRGGHGHEAFDIIHGTQHGISFVRLEHRWKTTSTDKDGKTTTHHHREYLCQFNLRFPFVALDLGSNLLGIGNERSGIQFESAAFNREYKVTSPNAKFAHDVLHPRMMEWLLARGAPRLYVRNGGQLRVPDGGKWDVEELELAHEFLFGFFGRVPDFVWQDLGAWPRPVPALL